MQQLSSNLLEKELDAIDQILAKFKEAREEHTPCE
jgi:hypothetical protein